MHILEAYSRGEGGVWGGTVAEVRDLKKEKTQKRDRTEEIDRTRARENKRGKEKAQQDPRAT